MPNRQEIFSVENPQIQEVLDSDSGRFLPVTQVISADYAEIERCRMNVRHRLADRSPKYLCSLCYVPVYLVRRPESKRFFFRHILEDGRCSAKTRGNLSEKEINRRKYHGVRESVAHKRMKDIVAESLRADPRFREVEIEPVWKSLKKNERRRPDVRGWFGNLPIAFEIQLSTTFIRVMAERRSFYLREGGLLFWILRGYDPAVARQTEDDVFYNNARNVFSVSEETLAVSRECHTFTLFAEWHEPHMENGNITWVERSRLVGFDELILDREGQRAFVVDADAAERNLKTEFDADLRNNFEQFWLRRSSGQREHSGWLSLRQKLGHKELTVPEFPDYHNLDRLLDVLYSAKHGRPIGLNYKNLVEIAHYVEDKHREYLWAFHLVLEAFDRHEQIIKEDTSGRWQEKAKAYKQDMADPTDFLYTPDREFDDLISFLFPEIEIKLHLEPHEILGRQDR